ncbi:hypothetical protein ANN_18378 [Periplaneta americana]|uniref:Uncharacterized protein n=1 Tax=Periplaneta americana TaxID=6978 RepID=A0ABQ8SNK9_PERAM|nr:hypothetical protein ANN_18378 [Periplaneta americana]
MTGTITILIPGSGLAGGQTSVCKQTLTLVKLKRSAVTVRLNYFTVIEEQHLERRLRWAGHVARMGESRNAYRVLVGRPEGKRPLGRPRRRWEDNIKMYLREVGYDDRDWINLAQDRDRWRAYVRAAMNLRFLKSHLYVSACVSIRVGVVSGMDDDDDDDEEEGRRGNPVPARSLLLSNSIKGAAKEKKGCRRRRIREAEKEGNGVVERKGWDRMESEREGKRRRKKREREAEKEGKRQRRKESGKGKDGKGSGSEKVNARKGSGAVKGNVRKRS